jgi:hypothetical protein
MLRSQPAQSTLPAQSREWEWSPGRMTSRSWRSSTTAPNPPPNAEVQSGRTATRFPQPLGSFRHCICSMR